MDKYELVYTLIRGKQGTRKKELIKGPKMEAHKKPLGYVLKELSTDELIAVSHLEAVEYENNFGITNVMTVVMTIVKDGMEKKIPYIKTKARCTPLQDPKFVIDPDRFLPDRKDIKITEELKKILSTKPKPKITEPKHTKEQINKIINERRQELLNNKRI